jgi:hypothetical protein
VYIRLRSELIYLLVSSRADKERRALPRHHNTTTPPPGLMTNDGGCVKLQPPARHASVPKQDALRLSVDLHSVLIIEIDCGS